MHVNGGVFLNADVFTERAGSCLLEQALGMGQRALSRENGEENAVPSFQDWA